MQVKKFEAPTIQEALEVIKKELGPEAIILQTRKMKKAFGLMSKESVEVTAAVSERSLHKKSFAENRLGENDREAVKKMPANRQGDLYDKYIEKQAASAARKPQPQSQKRMTATRYVDIDAPPAAASPRHQAETLEAVAAGRITREAVTTAIGQVGAGMTVEEELKHLKRMIEEMKTVQESETASSAVSGASAGMALATPSLQDAFEQLVLNGMDRRFALSLVKKAAFEIGEQRSKNPEYLLDQLAVEIMQSMDVVSPLSGIQQRASGSGPVVVALVGPTGVGKTTTVAKLASDAILKRNLKVGLINLDSYKVAAFDQLGTYAKILNVPFRSVTTADDLRVAIRDFSGLDLVIVDTTGRSQRDPGSLKEMQAMLQSVPDVRTHLVLSITTRDNELYDQANRFSVFRPQGIIASKLDEATIYGAIYNVSHKAKLPLLYFTTGQRVPEDIEEASRERIAALIMDL